MSTEPVVLANLILAHLLADFQLQRDVWVADKRKNGLYARGLYCHSLVVFLLSWLSVGRLDFWLYALLILGTHVVIDWLKTKFRRFSLQAFVCDQFLHLLILTLIAYCLYQPIAWQQWGFVPKGRELLWPVLGCAYVFCFSPANYFIREVLKHCKIKDRKGRIENRSPDTGVNATSKSAGALIGSFERMLVLSFILMGNYEAAGLTVAAKSLLRFNDNEGLRTEYVLVGTLLSFTLALASAIFILVFVMKFELIKLP